MGKLGAFVSVSLYSNCSITIGCDSARYFRSKATGVLGGDGFQTEGTIKNERNFR